MQWDYSYFFPVMAIASHVTHWGNRPMHFACSVALSVRFGMDLDLNKLSDEDKAICAGAVSAYKQIRDVTQLGGLYRLPLGRCLITVALHANPSIERQGIYTVVR